MFTNNYFWWLFEVFCMSDRDLTRLVMLFLRSKEHSKPSIFLSPCLSSFLPGVILGRMKFVLWFIFFLSSLCLHGMFCFVWYDTYDNIYCAMARLCLHWSHTLNSWPFCIFHCICPSPLCWAISYDNNNYSAPGPACLH